MFFRLPGNHHPRVRTLVNRQFRPLFSPTSFHGMCLLAEDALSILVLVRRQDGPYRDFDVRIELPVRVQSDREKSLGLAE
jgi:hypothetical protein